jgi:putative transcriptional regulator
VKTDDFTKLVASIKEAGAIKRGTSKPGRVYHFKTPDIKAIRSKLKVSQATFALMLGVSSRTLQNWEQGRREPDGPARALLIIAQKNPEAVLQALHS